jgi:hypothetical protein
MDTNEPSIELTERQRRLRELLSELKKSRGSFTLDEWIERWENLVTYLEDGYNEGSDVDDYVHELWKRHKVQEKLEAASVDIQRGVAAALDAIDNRFKRMTRVDHANVLARFFCHGGEWWWYRLPATLPKAMAATLSSLDDPSIPPSASP